MFDTCASYVSCSFVIVSWLKGTDAVGRTVLRILFSLCAETQVAKLLLSRKVLSARLQPGKDPAIVIKKIVELLGALDEVGITVHDEFIWLYFVGNLPPKYEFIKNNLQGSKEPLTRTVLEDALRSRYNVQSGEKKRKGYSGFCIVRVWLGG